MAEQNESLAALWWSLGEELTLLSDGTAHATGMTIGDDSVIQSKRRELDNLSRRIVRATTDLENLAEQTKACSDLVKELDVAMFQAASIPDRVQASWTGTPVSSRALSTAITANSWVIAARDTAYAVLQRMYVQIGERQTLLNSMLSTRQELATDLQSLKQSASSVAGPVAMPIRTLTPSAGGAR